MVCSMHLITGVIRCVSTPYYGYGTLTFFDYYCVPFPVPTLPPVPIYSPLCPLSTVLFLASYAYTTTLSPVLFYCNRLQRCSSNSSLTARRA